VFLSNADSRNPKQEAGAVGSESLPAGDGSAKGTKGDGSAKGTKGDGSAKGTKGDGSVNRGEQCGGEERPAINTSEEWHETGLTTTKTADGNERPLKEDASSVEMGSSESEKAHRIKPTGYHLYVDLDELLMYVYKNGELVKTYGVSGGKANSPSPLGTWKIINKDTWGEGFGGAWLGFNVPWGMYGIHGTTEPWSVGRSNTSKGCIRMKNDDARELYRMVPHNTPVTIAYKNIPFYPMRDGDVGSDVLAVERALKKLGYYHGGEDGVFGGSLKKAVMEFQKDHKLYRTGVVNNSTYEKILQLEKEYDEKKAAIEQEEKRKESELE